MKTKFDCLFALFEMKEARLGDLAKKTGSSPSSVRQRLKGFLKNGIVIQKGGKYGPNRDCPATWRIFNVMKSCRSRGINYNLFLGPDFAKIVRTGFGKETVLLGDFKSINPRTIRKYLTYLSRVNLLFIVSKRPLQFRFVSDPVFDEVMALSGAREENPAKSAKPGQSKKAGQTINYHEIENLLYKLREQKKNIDFSRAEEEQKIEFTSASTQLEGNTFTLEQAKELLLHDIVPTDKKLKEASEVKNYYVAVSHLINNLAGPVSLSLILDLHRIVVFNTGVKEGIRTGRVSIGGNPFYKLSHHSEILPALEALCKQINDFMAKKQGVQEAIEFATFVHNEFQHIHPFEDGNSRTARLLWNYALMRNGFPLISIYSNARGEYLSLTKLARNRDDAKLNAFLARTIQDNLFKLTRL